METFKSRIMIITVSDFGEEALSSLSYKNEPYLYVKNSTDMDNVSADSLSSLEMVILMAERFLDSERVFQKIKKVLPDGCLVVFVSKKNLLFVPQTHTVITVRNPKEACQAARLILDMILEPIALLRTDFIDVKYALEGHSARFFDIPMSFEDRLTGVNPFAKFSKLPRMLFGIYGDDTMGIQEVGSLGKYATEATVFGGGMMFNAFTPEDRKGEQLHIYLLAQSLQL